MDSESENTSPLLREMREKVRSEIERLVLSVVKSVAEGRQPVLEHIRVLYGAKNVTNTSVNLNTGETEPPSTTLIKFKAKRSQRKFALQLHLMSKVYCMVQKGQTCTKRDLFYGDVSLYGNQGRLEHGLNDLCLILKVPRDGLCVEATDKGLIAGNLKFTNVTGHRIDVSNFRGGLPVPNFIDGLRDIESDAQFIIIVEKDAIFQRLIGENIFASLGSMILVTGKGYPDIATRKFVRKLSSDLNLKVFVLVDCDPHGIEIAAIYRWGSYGQANLARCTDQGFYTDMHVPELIWLGLLPSEVMSLNLDINASAVMTPKDQRKLVCVEQRLIAQGDPLWIQEFNILKQMTRKAELEALFSLPRFVTQVYLKRKIQIYFQNLRQS